MALLVLKEFNMKKIIYALLAGDCVVDSLRQLSSTRCQKLWVVQAVKGSEDCLQTGLPFLQKSSRVGFDGFNGIPRKTKTKPKTYIYEDQLFQLIVPQKWFITSCQVSVLNEERAVHIHSVEMFEPFPEEICFTVTEKQIQWLPFLWNSYLPVIDFNQISIRSYEYQNQKQGLRGWRYGWDEWGSREQQ